MGIGVSFTGHDGRKRRLDVNGAPAPGSPLDRMLGRAEAPPPLVPKLMEPKLATQQAKQKTLEQMDPEKATVRVGPPPGCNDKDADGDIRVRPDGTGWRLPHLTRTYLEADPKTGQVTLFEYQVEDRKTPGGRTVGVTGEARRVVGSWTTRLEEGAPHPYEVRNFGDEQNPEWAIHLPSNILMVAGRYVDVASGLQPYYTEGGDDWFVCPVTDGRLFMKVSSWFYESALEDADIGYDANPHFDRKGSVNAEATFTDEPDKEDGTDTGMFSEWIEICNISEGKVYQKARGTIILHGPPCEPYKSKVIGNDEVDLLNIYRVPDGCIALSAPIKIVGSGGTRVTHSGGGIDGAHVFTISSDEGGGGGGDSDTPDFSEGITGNKTVVAAIRYDATAHKLQAKFATATYTSGIVTGWAVDAEWTDVFEAEEHSAEVS